MAKTSRRGLGKGVKELFRKSEPAARIPEPAVTNPAGGMDAYEDKAAVCLHRLTRRTFGETVTDVGQAIAALDELRDTLLAAARWKVEEQARLTAQARQTALEAIERAANGTTIS